MGETVETEKPEPPDCEMCRDIDASGGFGPPHNASPNCQSGGRNHCTCDVCF